MGERPTKTCASCGREIVWRKKWERDWEGVKYCSQACRRAGVGGVDRELEEAILRLLAERGAGKTICPSEAAKVVGGAEESSWRALMEPARRAARRLVASGKCRVLQGGREVDPSRARGAIRIGSV